MNFKDRYSQETEARVGLILGAFRALPPSFQWAVVRQLMEQLEKQGAKALEDADRLRETVEEFEASVLSDVDLHRIEYPEVRFCDE